MDEISKAIKGARDAQRGRIYGSFSNYQEVTADEDAIRKGEECDIEKSRSGIYADTAENRKLNRVGQQYGSKKQKDVSKQKSESEKHLELRELLKKESNRVLMNITNDKRAPDYMRTLAKEEFARRSKKGDDGTDVKINDAIEELTNGSHTLHTLWDNTFKPDEDVSENSKKWEDAQRDYYENDKNYKPIMLLYSQINDLWRNIT